MNKLLVMRYLMTVVGVASSLSGPTASAVQQPAPESWSPAGDFFRLAAKVRSSMKTALTDQAAWSVFRTAMLERGGQYQDLPEGCFRSDGISGSRLRFVFSMVAEELTLGAPFGASTSSGLALSARRAVVEATAREGLPANLSAAERTMVRAELLWYLPASQNQVAGDYCSMLAVWPGWTVQERLEFATLNLQASRFEGASAYILGRLDDGAEPFMLAHVQTRWADGQDVALPTIDRLTKREYLALKPTVDAMLATASQGGMCGGRPCSDFVSVLTSIQARLALPTMPTQDILAYIESADGSRSVGYGAADEQRVRAVKVLVRRGVALSTIRQSILTFAVKLKGDGQPSEDWSRSPATLAIFKSNVFPLGVLEKDDIPEARLIPASSMIGPQTVWP